MTAPLHPVDFRRMTPRQRRELEQRRRKAIRRELEEREERIRELVDAVVPLTPQQKKRS